MKFKMTQEDRCAVDLLLEQGSASAFKGWSASCFNADHGARLRHRVETVEKVLGVLAEMPASDPPANLVARTLRKVEREGHRHSHPVSHEQTPAQTYPTHSYPSSSHPTDPRTLH
jgi:hypothetical protein